MEKTTFLTPLVLQSAVYLKVQSSRKKIQIQIHIPSQYPWWHTTGSPLHIHDCQTSFSTWRCKFRSPSLRFILIYFPALPLSSKISFSFFTIFKLASFHRNSIEWRSMVATLLTHGFGTSWMVHKEHTMALKDLVMVHNLIGKVRPPPSTIPFTLEPTLLSPFRNYNFHHSIMQ